ncbi:MAG: DegT/DnrJ/EryC1/StrS family aminotransferase [Candidatus Saelkia tenebricola]|nr:DegT/DnrJ/EryC1/StrS family aminotransferase [Candidatus Saelkia tenebricola]
MKIKSIDFSREYDLLKNKLDKKFSTVSSSGGFILGKELIEFEKEFAAYCGVKFAVGVNSGTDALYISLLSLGIGQGDEVIVPDFTYIATAMAVSYTAAVPVFCDIKEDTFEIDPKDLERKITSRTKAIIPVHLYGHPVEMRSILKIAKKHNLKVVEDCAQAHGAKIKGKKVGGFADCGCFSFYPTKNLGCYGDGGIIVTNSDRLYKKILKLRDYGRESKYRHVLIGYNSRLDTLQAGILRIKLEYLDVWNNKRKELAYYYNEYLKGIDEIILPNEKEMHEHVYHVYVARIKKNRDVLIKQLFDLNIPVLIHYPIPCHLQPVYKNLGYKKGDFPVSEMCAKEVMSLPLYPFLKKEEVRFIASSIKKLLLR